MGRLHSLCWGWRRRHLGADQAVGQLDHEHNLPYQITTDGFYFNLDRSLGQMNYQFAWAVMAGVAIAMTEQAQLDVGLPFS